MPLDLNSILPQLLMPAIAWAELQARQVELEGQSLDATGLVLAAKVGVRRPDLIRTKLVDELPLPDQPILQEATIQTGLLSAPAWLA